MNLTRKKHLSIIVIAAIFTSIAVSCSGGGTSGSAADSSGFLTIEIDTDSSNASPDSIVTLLFSSPINQATVNNETFRIISPEGNDIDGSISFSQDSLSAAFTSVIPYDYGSTYTVIVTNGVSDVNGKHPAETVTCDFTVREDDDAPDTVGQSPSGGGDTQSPASVNLTPSQGGESAAVNAPITVVFDEPVDPASVTADTFSVCLEDGTPVTGTFAFTNGNTTVTFNHNDFPYSEIITVTIAGILDSAGNACGSISWSFLTADEPDTTAPVLAGVTPSPGAVDIDINESVRVDFSEPIALASICGTSFYVTEISSGKKIDGTFSYENGNKRILFTPSSFFVPDNQYSVTLTSSITDEAGNRIGAREWTFVTKGGSGSTNPLVIEFSPYTSDPAVPINTIFSARFNKELNSSTVNTSSVQLMHNGSTVAGSVTYYAQAQTITFTPDENLEADADFTIYLDSTISDTEGNYFDGASWNVTTASTVNEDYLEVFSISPEDGSVGNWDMPLHNSSLLVKFMQPVNPGSVDTMAFELEKDGSVPVDFIVEMLDSTTVRITPNSNLDRESLYTVSVTTMIEDLCGNSVDTGEPLTSAAFNTLEKLKVVGHFYKDGSYNKDYISYDTAFSDTYSDSGVAIHSYIVVEFNFPVDPAEVSEKIFVKRDSKGTDEIADSPLNNYNVIGKVHDDFPDYAMPDGEYYIGWAEADPFNSNRIIFKHQMVFYANRGGAFDNNNPNWNGIKPNYEYDVSVLNGILDAHGGEIAAESGENVRNWSFTTTDLDYGLYWFKDGYHALKYVPGRQMPVEYYNPQDPVMIYSHGWQADAVGTKGGVYRDYSRENFLWGGNIDGDGGDWDSGMYGTIDVFDAWINGSDTTKYPNGGGKDWNVGVIYWEQFSDNKDVGGLEMFGFSAGEMKPRRAQTPIWSMYGPSSQADQRAEYAVNILSDEEYQTVHTADNSPDKALGTVFADVFQSAFGSNRPDGYDTEFRLSGHSLGNQMVHAVLMVLKTRHENGQIDDTVMPTRFFLIDPYWVDTRERPWNGDGTNGFWENNEYGDWDGIVTLNQGYWGRDECPAKPLVDAGLISGNKGPGIVCTEIIKNVLEYYETAGIKGQLFLPYEIYDVSRTSDGQVGSFGLYIYCGDKNQKIREQAAMVYDHYQWIGGQSSSADWGRQHVNGRHNVLYTYGFAAPSVGLSQGSSNADVYNAMNRYKSDDDKGRFAYSGGTGTSSCTDNTYTWETSNEDFGGQTYLKADTGGWMR